jgi:lipopolysaccharide/colanic/teichoic acid biosynthesis glycosyltransferase
MRALASSVPSTAVRLCKRALDVAASTTGLALTLPFYPLIAGAIVLDSPGPVFFSQQRAGRLLDGRGLRFETFTLHKFRTMCVDAEAKTGAILAAEDDPRVTRVGRFLRTSRIDELPQLWDVLRGALSLVGPRPERPELLTRFAAAIPYFEERMRGVKPGLTGLAQVSLGYAGHAPPGSAIAEHERELVNPFHLEKAEGALADDLRVKLLYDLAYGAALEDFGTWLRTELSIVLRTPAVMLGKLGR